MTEKTISFMDYWEAVDAAMMKLFGIDTCDANIEVDVIASAEEGCWTPEECARWIGKNDDLHSVYGRG